MGHVTVEVKVEVKIDVKVDVQVEEVEIWGKVEMLLMHPLNQIGTINEWDVVMLLTQPQEDKGSIIML